MAGRDSHDGKPSSDPAGLEAKSVSPDLDDAFRVIVLRAPPNETERIQTLLGLLHLENASVVLFGERPANADRSHGALAAAAERPVLTARDGLMLEAGTVYVVEPQAPMGFVAGKFRAVPHPQRDDAFQATFDLEKALASHYGERLVRIALPYEGAERVLNGAGGTALWTVGEAAKKRRRAGNALCILLVEENEPMRDLLVIGLVRAGYHVAATRTVLEAAALLRRGAFVPDLILAEPSACASMIAKAAARGGRGDAGAPMSVACEEFLNGGAAADTETMRRLHKPLRVKEIIRAIDDLLPRHRGAVHSEETAATAQEDESFKPDGDWKPGFAEIIVGDRQLSNRLLALLVRHGWSVLVHKSEEDFMRRNDPQRESCLFLFDEGPGRANAERLERLKSERPACPAIVLVRGNDIGSVVSAMKAGAQDVLALSASDEEILRAASQAADRAREDAERQRRNSSAQSVLQQLTHRQREILDRIICGEQNKVIAAALGLSQRTVENHRATIMRKTGSTSLSALLRLVMLAEE